MLLLAIYCIMKRYELYLIMTQTRSSVPPELALSLELHARHFAMMAECTSWLQACTPALLFEHDGDGRSAGLPTQSGSEPALCRSCIGHQQATICLLEWRPSSEHDIYCKRVTVQTTRRWERQRGRCARVTRQNIRRDGTLLISVARPRQQ